jgi:hypothetical protein
MVATREFSWSTVGLGRRRRSTAILGYWGGWVGGVGVGGGGGLDVIDTEGLPW